MSFRALLKIPEGRVLLHNLMVFSLLEVRKSGNCAAHELFKQGGTTVSGGMLFGLGPPCVVHLAGKSECVYLINIIPLSTEKEGSASF